MSNRPVPNGFYLDESTVPAIGKATLRRIDGQPTLRERLGMDAATLARRAIGKKARVPNKTETEYGLILRGQWPGCMVKYEPITFRCDSCNYTPDYIVFGLDGNIVEINEVKGPHMREKDLLRLKAAAAQFPFKFYLNQKLKSGWTRVKVRGLHLAQHEQIHDTK